MKINELKCLLLIKLFSVRLDIVFDVFQRFCQVFTFKKIVAFEITTVKNKLDIDIYISMSMKLDKLSWLSTYSLPQSEFIDITR